MRERASDTTKVTKTSHINVCFCLLQYNRHADGPSKLYTNCSLVWIIFIKIAVSILNGSRENHVSLSIFHSDLHLLPKKAQSYLLFIKKNHATFKDQLFIASYYRQLSSDIKMKDFMIETSFVTPENTKTRANKTGINFILIFVENCL